MLKKPAFKPCYSISTIEPDQVFLVSERDSHFWQDPILYLVASLIDGDRTHEEIVELIQQKILEEQDFSQNKPKLLQKFLDISLRVQAALLQLQRNGYLIDNVHNLPSHLISYCHYFNVDPSQASDRLQSTTVAIDSFCPDIKRSFIDHLESLNIQTSSDAESDSVNFKVILTDDYLNQTLSEANLASQKSQIPWILVKPIGTVIWLGPIFNPQQTACWECLASRLAHNRPVEQFIKRSNNDSLAAIVPQERLSSTIETALGMAAIEVFKWIIQQKNERLNNTLITFDTLTLQTQEHHVVKRPQCPCCGLQEFVNQQPLPIGLGRRQKNFTDDGGYRFCPPQETLRNYQHHLSPLTGIVRELTKLSEDRLNHSYIAKHHFVTIFDDLENLRKNLGGRSCGKGRTDIQARASGFCEAIERYSGVFQGNEMRTRSSFQQMRNQAIHPNHCLNFSQQQYEERRQWNSSCQGWFQKVPEPFDENREIDWTPVWSLTHQDFKYLPTAYCYFGYPQSYLPDCWADTNGCAAGNTIEEAILQGFMELVERDAVALWWYNRLLKPSVDVESFEEPYFQDLKKYYEQLGREFWILDITSDFNIPSFAAISCASDRPTEDIIFGFGTHFDAKIAMSRALTELNQLLPSVLSTNADGATQYPQSADPLAINWWTSATLAAQDYLSPDPKLDRKLLSDYPPFATDDLLDDINLCQAMIEAKNLEMLVLDQTRPDIELRVVKVIIPGMRHMWRRLGQGRLYEVPIDMGWLSEPITENQVNPFPMWM